MKRLVSALLVPMILMFSTNEVFATPIYKSQEFNKIETSILAGQEFTQEQTSRIFSENITLNNCHIDTSAIEKVKVTSSGNEYTLDYNGVDEIVLLEKNDNGSVTIKASDGKKSNVITFEQDGSIILDGYKVQITEVGDDNSYASARGTIWKGEKSLSPFGSLKPSSYNHFLSSGKQNISLGKSLDNLTITALSAIIGSLHTYAGIAMTLTGIAKSVYDVLVEVNPKTQYLGCAYTTYTAGASDYKYINKFYANKQCSGRYRQEISYEHFTVY
ncbi:hypothetical protein [Lacrimispora xylanisolvens]|uniref:hypothetical protein n=1 Tax=Lacrimispora xylanisolvens TaxID=384636 RepID=UPI002402843A|nr:hypothetical protein [Paenibacillaceae bacterium]